MWSRPKEEHPIQGCALRKKTGEPYRLPTLPVIVFIQFSWLPEQSIIQLTS